MDDNPYAPWRSLADLAAAACVPLGQLHRYTTPELLARAELPRPVRKKRAHPVIPGGTVWDIRSVRIRRDVKLIAEARALSEGTNLNALMNLWARTYAGV